MHFKHANQRSLSSLFLLQTNVSKEVKLKSDIKIAVKNDHFYLYMQAITCSLSIYHNLCLDISILTYRLRGI